MEEAPENGKESSNSAHAKWMNEWMIKTLCYLQYFELRDVGTQAHGKLQ